MADLSVEVVETADPTPAPAAAAEPVVSCVQKREPGKVTKIIKIGVMGDGTVGKTTFLLAYVTHGFVQEYTPTVFDNFSAIEEVGGEVVNIILWDLAGQDEYSAMRTTCYTNCRYDVLLLCFSVVHRDSFDNVKYKWLPELAKIGGGTVPVILVGTKTDLRAAGDPAHVTAAQGERLAKEIKARRYLECTAKEPPTVGKLVLEGISIILEQDRLRKVKDEKQYKKEKKEEDKMAARIEKERKKREKAEAKAAAETK